MGQLLLCGAATEEDTACYYSPHAIRSWVDLSGGPEGISFLENVFRRSGDRMAVGIVHAFKENELKDFARARRILFVLRVAFSEPLKIARKEDSDPAVTYLLLAYLQERETDRALLDEIVRAKESIAAALQQPAK
jgi:hypothetical protein